MKRIHDFFTRVARFFEGFPLCFAINSKCGARGLYSVVTYCANEALRHHLKGLASKPPVFLIWTLTLIAWIEWGSR